MTHSPNYKQHVKNATMKTTIDITLSPTGTTNDIDLQKMTDLWNQYADKHITITVDKFKKKRTNPQNAYFHGVVVVHVRMGLVSAGTLVTAEQVKDYLKHEFASVTKPLIGDDYIKVSQPTSEMTTTEFMEFVERIQQWAGEFLGIVIPDPEHEFDD